MDLTYSVCFTPSVKQNDDLNFICFDHKVHVRLRDYEKVGVVAGFEKKLSYLLSYLLNFSYLPSILNSDLDSDKILKAFLNSEDVRIINKCIFTSIPNLSFNGIKIYKNYNKKQNKKDFGELRETLFPVNLNELNIITTGSLKFFLESINLDLKSYLFDDRYSIIFHKASDKDINEKFENKKLRKTRSIEGFEIVDLW